MSQVIWDLLHSGFLLACQPLFHGLIRQRPEVREDSWRFWRIHQALREQDADHAFGGIGVYGCAEAAGPAEAARHVVDFFAPSVDCQAASFQAQQ
jgi:hypothetical protein